MKSMKKRLSIGNDPIFLFCQQPGKMHRLSSNGIILIGMQVFMGAWRRTEVEQFRT